jgi:hypothetical protein
MPELNTQLTSAKGYNVNRMRFSKPIIGNIPDSKPAISFKRINITTKNEDGTEGELIIPTTELFSFGVSENKSQETGNVNGYVMPLCLYNKDGASEEEEDFVKTFNNIVEAAKKHLLDNKDEIEKYDLDERDLKSFNPLYYKKEKGKIVEGQGPTLYAKLIVSKKQDKIVSFFTDRDDNPLNALDLLGKYCYANAAIKFESMFIGNKISFQVKLYEASVRLSNSGMRRLITKARPVAETEVKIATSTSVPLNIKADDDDANSVGSIAESDSEDEPKPTPVLKKPVAKTVKRPIAKKA